mgnify:CR=1 FL=1
MEVEPHPQDGYSGVRACADAGVPIPPVAVAQGGDTQHGTSPFGESIWGGAFADESFALSHDEAGVLSMANSGANTNRAQFFVLFAPQAHLDGKHVVFGKVVHGMEVLKHIEDAGSAKGPTSVPVVMTSCSVATNA